MSFGLCIGAISFNHPL